MMATATAQGASAPIANGHSLTAEELRQIDEYEKIVRFRDTVVAGTHPRIKIPSHLVGKQVNNATRNFSSPNPSTTSRAPVSKPHNRSTSGKQHEMSSPNHNNKSSPSNHRPSANGFATMSTKSGINPILLEKSDDLIKAELQLHRQRLERGLRDQVEQQRLAARAQASEVNADFDLADVLTKAIAIIHPSATSATADDAPSVGVRSAASDSFDDNTFYSSQHDTPELSSPSQGNHDPLEAPDGVVSAYGRPAQIYSAHDRIGEGDVVMTGASLSIKNHLPRQSLSQSLLSSSRIGLQHAANHFEQTREQERANSSNSLRLGGKAGAQKRGNTVSTYRNSFPIKLANMGSWLDFQESDVDDCPQDSTEDLQHQGFENVDPTVIRAHNLSPYAPQPARVSPLATARNPPVLRENHPTDEAPPAAQVAALRKPGPSSADSSPKAGKPPSAKKKDKKRKKKASNKDDVPTPDSPYIKPEPQSPSPFAVAPLPRPPKRQRQSGQFASELNYDEPRYEDEVRERVIKRVPERYERYEERYEPEIRRPEPIYQRIERDDVEYRRVSDGNYVRRPQSPVYSYAPSEVRSVRAASHAIVERRPREEPVYYREPPLRASVRPDADRERSRSPIMRERRSPVPMGPPRQPVRIVVDAYGREYIDPTPAPSMRQSVAPTTRYRDSEVVYERAPVRTVSSRAAIEYDEDGRVYRRPSPTEMVPRRVVTQPEYAVPEHRAYRQREYSVRPMGPPGDDYAQLRGVAERRQMSHFDEAPREYIPRAASVRPAPVAERYEMPREYISGQSVRPEARDTVQSQREYSVRPAESAPRHVGGREGERYYEEVPSHRAAEPVFIERPRAREQSVMVYADDVRREVRKDVYR